MGRGIGWYPVDSHLPLAPFGQYTVLSCDENET